VRGSLHHVELWVPDLARAEREWGWLLGRDAAYLASTDTFEVELVAEDQPAPAP
jgi:hypothetical protein